MAKPRKTIRTSLTLPIDVYLNLRDAAKTAGAKTPSKYLEGLLSAGMGGVLRRYVPPKEREDFARKLRKKAVA